MSEDIPMFIVFNEPELLQAVASNYTWKRKIICFV